jgi:NADH dehydrogenase FAD-containing subunit
MKLQNTIKKPKVIVVGGSFAGLCTIRHLKKFEGLDVTLIDKKDYFEYTPGALHLLAGSNGDLFSPLEDVTKG